MRRDLLEIDTLPPAPPRRRWLEAIDVEAIRLFLTGGSVVDWYSVAFNDHADVDRYLATLLLDVDSPIDRKRLRYVFNEAVSYLEEHLHLRFPPELRAPADVRDVFLLAGERKGFRRTQVLACVILKLMHTIHHLEAADLRFRTPISEYELNRRAHARIVTSLRHLQDAGLGVTTFYGSTKSRGSVITKLLAKAENVAATLFDKLRYRIVVAEHSDLAPTLGWMTRNLFPFNYVIPRQSHNNLLGPDDLTRWLRPGNDVEEQDELPVLRVSAKNEHSGSSYRMINAIVDFPVRLPEVPGDDRNDPFGQVVFVLAEFQVVDEVTARSNEVGENAHHRYKSRQTSVVERRLRRGAAARRRSLHDEEPG